MCYLLHPGSCRFLRQKWSWPLGQHLVPSAGKGLLLCSSLLPAVRNIYSRLCGLRMGGVPALRLPVSAVSGYHFSLTSQHRTGPFWVCLLSFPADTAASPHSRRQGLSSSSVPFREFPEFLELFSWKGRTFPFQDGCAASCSSLF